MSGIYEMIGRQFRRPSGFLGGIIAMIMKRGNSAEYDITIPELNIRKNDRVLEIGFGHGLGINMILSKYDCFVTGIDISELMYRKAMRKFRNYIEANRLRPVRGDIATAALLPGHYDVVFCIHVIYFWDNLDTPFSRIKETLKEGGLFCMFMAYRKYLDKMKMTKEGIFNKYSIGQVMNALQLSGFAETGYTETVKGYIIKCRK